MSAPAPENQFALDVRAGLARTGQKSLPSSYLYDELGSALFDAITCLPEYGLTRADARLLRAHAGEIVERLPRRLAVMELGSGSGTKTRPILERVSGADLWSALAQNFGTTDHGDAPVIDNNRHTGVPHERTAKAG